jgi:hypothetical protein
MEDVEDIEVCRDDSAEDMEGEQRMIMGSTTRVEVETNGH